MKSVLGIGSFVVDLLLPVSENFLEKISGPKYGMQPVDYPQLQSLIKQSGIVPKIITGGSACNTICGLSHIGHPCQFIGKLGKDEHGKNLINYLRKLNIQVNPIFSSFPTTQVLCLITPNGERTFRSFSSPANDFQPKDLDISCFQQIDLIHIEGYTLSQTNVVEHAMQLGKQVNAKISFDLGCFDLVLQKKETVKKLITSYIDILFCNENELKALIDTPVREAALTLSTLCECVIVFLGAKGVLISSKDQIFHHPAIKAQPIDTTGAGDLFASGFLHGYLEGDELEACAYYGTLAGSEAVKTFGAQLPPSKWKEIKYQITKRRQLS